MNKQTPLALLMATIAILMLAIACGSSDNTITSPTQTATTQPEGPTNVPSEEPTQTRTRETATAVPTPPRTATPTTDATTGPTAEIPTSSPQPTPLPTRRSLLTRQPENQPTEAPTISRPTNTPLPTRPTRRPPPTPETLPEYDGTSPLIHVYVDQAFLYFGGQPGASITIPLRGITQNGQKVSISDPASWDITFEQWIKSDHYEVDENGRYTIRGEEGSFFTYGTVKINLNQADTHFLINLRHPWTGGQPPTPVPFEYRNPNTLESQCWVELERRYTVRLNWFYIAFKDMEAYASFEEQLFQKGAVPRVLLTFDGGRPTTVMYPDKVPHVLVEYPTEGCPSMEEMFHVTGEWASIPGIRQVLTIHHEDEYMWRILD